VSWPQVDLYEVCEINVGKTPSRHNELYWGSGQPWLSIRDMSQGLEIVDTKEQITDLAIKESNIKIVTAGTVLFSFKLSIGKIGIAQKNIYTNEAIAALPIKDDTKLCKEYLVHALSRWEFGIKTHRAVMGATLNKEKLQSLKIPLPPLKEQKRIAAILDKADNLRRKRQQAIQLADEFLRAVFLDMFGDPVTNPKGWEMKSLKEMAVVTTGNTPSRNEPDYYGDYIEWIKSDNINTPSNFLTTAKECLSKKGYEVGRHVSAGSTLITCIAGSFDCIGNAAFADRQVAFNQQINALTPKQGINSWFLYALVIFSKKHIQAASTNSMKGMISKGKMEVIQFICPPESLQMKFEKAFSHCRDNREKMDESMFEINNTFSAINQKAFSGQL